MQSHKWQNDLCSFPRQAIGQHSNPSLCPNQSCWRSWSWMVLWRPTTPSGLTAVILEPKKIKYLTVSIFSPSICQEVIGPDAMILVLLILSFKPAFSLSSFTFLKRLFSSSSLYAIRVVSSAYVGLLIFLQAILIPVCASSSSAFCMIYSAYKLNKQGNNTQSWHMPFPIWNQPIFPCVVLAGASWPAHRLLRRQGEGSLVFSSL